MLWSAAAGFLLGIVVGWVIRTLTHDTPPDPAPSEVVCTTDGRLEVRRSTAFAAPAGFTLERLRAQAVATPGNEPADPDMAADVGTAFPFTIDRDGTTGTVHVYAYFSTRTHGSIAYDCTPPSSGGGSDGDGAGESLSPEQRATLQLLPREVRVAAAGPAGGSEAARAALAAVPPLRLAERASTPRVPVWRAEQEGRRWTLRVRPAGDGFEANLTLDYLDGRERHTLAWAGRDWKPGAETRLGPTTSPPPDLVVGPA